jgi:hypothetical protein
MRRCWKSRRRRIMASTVAMMMRNMLFRILWRSGERTPDMRSILLSLRPPDPSVHLVSHSQAASDTFKDSFLEHSAKDS